MLIVQYSKETCLQAPRLVAGTRVEIEAIAIALQQREKETVSVRASGRDTNCDVKVDRHQG